MALNYIPQFRKLPNVPSTLMPGVVLSTTLSVSDNSGIIYFNNLTQNIDGVNTENNSLITFKSVERDNKQLYTKATSGTPNIIELLDGFDDDNLNTLVTSDPFLPITMKKESFGLINFTSEDGVVNQIKTDDYLSQIRFGGIDALLYYGDDQIDEYIRTSAPIMVNIGLDTVGGFGLNPSNISRGDGDVVLNQLNVDIPANDIVIGDSLDNNVDGLFPNTFNPNTDWWQAWNLSYVNKRSIDKGYGSEPTEVPNVVINHENAPYGIEVVKDQDPSEESLGFLQGSKGLCPNVQLLIRFFTPISPIEFPIKVMDRVQLWPDWPQEYTVVDLIGNENGINLIALDVFFPGGMNANSSGNVDKNIGEINGIDMFGGGVTNKAGLLPPPYETLEYNGIVDAYAVAEGNVKYFDRIISNPEWVEPYVQNQEHVIAPGTIIPSSYLDFKGVDSDIVFTRPMSQESDANQGFTEIIFEEDDIKTTRGNEEISLFPELALRSPRTIHEQLPRNNSHAEGFKNPGSNRYSNGILNTDAEQAKNITLQIKHGQHGTDRDEVDGNQRLISENGIRVRLPFFNSSTQGPSVDLYTDSEFYLSQREPIDFSLITNSPGNGFFRIEATVQISEVGDFDYGNQIDLQLGVGVLDLCLNDGTPFKTFSESELTYDVNVGTTVTLRSKIFKVNQTVSEYLGRFYLYINATGMYSYDTDGLRDQNDGIRVRLDGYEVEVVDVEETGADADVQIFNPINTPVYKYLVLEWGDEKRPFNNQQIRDTFYFKYYDEDEDDSSLNLINAKNLFNALDKSKYIKLPVDGDEDNVQIQLSSHFYQTGGLKKIKIILFRLDNTESQLIETSLIQSNIYINDGLALTKDFEIFGGTDFTLLPLGSDEAIIGGLSGDSDYVENVKKLITDDRFDNDEIVIRKTANTFTRNFKRGNYGQYPNDLDLGTTRVFKQPRSIYDFIGLSPGEQVVSNFNIPNGDDEKLPLNSFATDIFISDEECLLDINPQNLDFVTISNSAGRSRENGILIGDYKIKKPKDSKIQKQGIMKTPQLEKNNDKQAF